jgi:hypothetical protein
VSDFAAQIDAWATESADRLERIWKASSQELGSIANRNPPLPVDTGFLRASFQASTEAMPSINSKATNKDRNAAPSDFGQISAVIATATLGQTVYMGWTAAYAMRLEFGFSGVDSLGREYNQPPIGFARLAAAQWPSIVSSVVAEAKSRAG